MFTETTANWWPMAIGWESPVAGIIEAKILTAVEDPALWSESPVTSVQEGADVGIAIFERNARA